jgi:Flp pilus assembly protein TadG
LRCESGSALPLVGLATLALVGASGIAVDMGRVQIVQSRMTNALDAAGLAAGSVINTTNITTETNKYFYANFPVNYMGTTINSVTAVPNSNNTKINLTASGTVPMTLMKVFGITSMPVSASSEITRSNKGMELVLVLDITGSMWSNNNYLSLRAAATDLINILYGTNETMQNLWVSVVPYVTAVNIGNHHSTWLSNYSLSVYPANYPVTAKHAPANTYWKGCVEERPSPYDTTDDPPSATNTNTLFPMYFWADSAQDNDWIAANGTVSLNEAVNYSDSGGKSPNISCGERLLPFTSSKTPVLNKISSLNPWRKSGTASATGLAWGWRVLSPRWRGLWDHETVGGSTVLPHDYNHPLIQKVVVIETDGINEFFRSASSSPPYSDYGGYKRLNTTAGGGRPDFNTQTTATGVTIVNNKTLAICSAMKAKGILIYTITFKLGSSAQHNAARTMWRSCASRPEYYFDAESQVSGAPTLNLNTAFKQIGDSLANLRISK